MFSKYNGWFNDYLGWRRNKTLPTNFNEKDITCKAQNFYILLVFLLITIALLKTVSKYCCLIKYQAKEKHLLPFRGTKLKLFCFGSINWKFSIKDIYIKNHIYYFFDDIINIKDFDDKIILK